MLERRNPQTSGQLLGPQSSVEGLQDCFQLGGREIPKSPDVSVERFVHVLLGCLLLQPVLDEVQNLLDQLLAAFFQKVQQPLVGPALQQTVDALFDPLFLQERETKTCKLGKAN